MDLLLGIGIWLVTVVALFVFFVIVIGEKYFPSVMGFRSLDKVIRKGMLAVCCAGASFLFLPLVFRIDVKPIKDEIASRVGTGIADMVTPAVVSVRDMVQKGLVTMGIVATLLVAVGIVVAIIAYRESMGQKQQVYQRRHLFEYQQQVFEKINNDNVRS